MNNDVNNDIKVVDTANSWMYLSSAKPLQYELTESFMMFFYTYTIIATIVHSSVGQPASIYRGMFLLPLTMLSTYILYRVKYLSLFTLFNLSIVALAFGITYLGGFTMVERVFYTVYITFWVVSSFKSKYKEYISYFTIMNLLVAETVLAVCFAVASITRQADLGVFITAVAIMQLVIGLIYIYITRTQNLLGWEIKYASRFADRVRKLKLITSSLIGGCLLFILGLIWKSGLLSYIDRIQNKFLSYFNFQSLVNRGPNEVEQVTPEPISKEMMEKHFTGETRELSKVALFIFQVIGYIAIAVAVVIVLMALVTLLKNLYNGFYKQKNRYEEREIIIPDEDIKGNYMSRVEGLKRRVRDIFDGSNRKKIRTIYSKAMIKYKKKGVEVLQTNTPFELQEKIKEKKGDDVREITAIYEKARYSTLECTDSDVNRVLEHYKNFKGV
jgi:hypothetical protein